MKFNWKKNPYVCGGLALFAALAALLIFYKVVNDFSGVLTVFSTVAGILMPFLVGLTLAYLLAPIYDFVQKPFYRWFAGKKEQPRRFAKVFSKAIATVATISLLLVIVGGLLSLVIPEAINSITELINYIPGKTQEIIAWFEQVSSTDGIPDYVSEALAQFTTGITAWVHGDLLSYMGEAALQLSTGLIGFLGTISNVFIGVIICVYALNSKELFAAQAKKVTYALFNTPTANYLIHMTRYIDQTFGRYINGMLLDAFLLGATCFVGMSILQLPYAPLISVVVGLCNLVPLFGPIVGAVFGCFFILLKSPWQAFVFLIFFIVVQQIDANIVAPKILGGKTGLTSFWVVFAIVVGGGLFGVPGMILGVPAFAVIYTLFQQFVRRRLQKKSYPDQTEAYNGLWTLDEENGAQYDVPEDRIGVPQFKRKDRNANSSDQ